MSIVSGMLGASATKSAGEASASAQNYASDIQKKIYDQTRTDFEPYRAVGLGAIPMLQDAVTGKWTPNMSPAAKYQLRQGNTTLMRSLEARGQAGGGGAAYKLADLSQRVAASDYQDQYSRLLDLVKIGTGASASTGAAASTYGGQVQQGANNLSSLYQNQGQQRASMYSGIGQANGQVAGAVLKNWGSGGGGEMAGSDYSWDGWVTQ